MASQITSITTQRNQGDQRAEQESMKFRAGRLVKEEGFLLLL